MKEQEVIKRLNFHKEYVRLYSSRVVMISETDLETVLNMLKEKDELYHKALEDLVKADRENIKKDKIIDLITEFLGERDLGYYKKEDGGEFLGMMRIYNKDDWKQYFKEIAERKSKE